MGQLMPLAPPTDAGRLVVTPHPVLLDGQRNIECDLRPGETLYAFLARHIDLTQQWEVSIGGVVVPVELWVHVWPKHGQVIEVRAALGKAVLYIVALVALTYFTFGAGATWAGALGATGFGATAVYAGTYLAGAYLINRALGPKPPAALTGSAADPTYNLSGQRNTFRPFEPVPLLFGKVRVTPDLATDQPYTFYRGNDQYLALTLNLGVNVDRVDELYEGDALLSDFEGVEVYHTGFHGMAEDGLPLYSNTDTVAGGTLDSPPNSYIQRTSAAETVRLECDFEYNIYDFAPDGSPRWNSEGLTVQYRAVGDSTWLTLGSTTLSGDRPRVRRRTLTKVVPVGQYEVQAKRNAQDTDGSGAHCEVTWVSLRSIQNDTGNYAGLSRIGVVCKATGQLNGALDELRCVAYSRDLEYWDGAAWVTDGTRISNPGAQILKYARGYYDEDGVLIAGMGLSDSMIDLEAFKGFILHCDANGYQYNYQLKEGRNHRETRDSIALAGFGQTTWAGGKLSVCWAADEQPLSGVVNMATIKRGQFQVDYTLAGSADGIEFTYLDESDWANKTLRVPAPGVTTMLNPARVAGEGITSEAHAAQMARYHLAQNLYQYKAITFGADLEHLSYRRLDKLALQHDLTRWGYGGRVQSVVVDGGGVVTVTLDEAVPAGGAPYIGLRIPGESVYRVFEVEPPAEETRVIVLSEAWPGDAALPGDSANNPAHDTIWIYDFKTEPGYRVRVVGIEPDDGLKGARVSVVPESDEFWTYVLTGDYEPPATSTLPSVRPVASNAQVAEQVISQGGTAHSELIVSFDVAGNMGRALVFAQYTDTADPLNPITDGEVRKVAETATREASFRIPGRGTYDITIKPYGVDGVAGGSASVSYDTENTDIEPPLFDTFSVSEESGGIRRFAWGYNAGTIPPPDLAGAVIRYALSTPSGDPNATAWDDMTALGADGFHASFFDSVLPPGSAPAWSNATTYAVDDRVMLDGTVYRSKLASNLNHEPSDTTWWEDVGAGLTYVFAARPRTANGVEPEDGDTRYAITLSASLPELAAGALDMADAATIAAAAAQEAADDAQSAADAAAAAVGDVIGDMDAILGASEWSAAVSYSIGQYAYWNGVVYRSNTGPNLNHEPPNVTHWSVVGSVYAALGIQGGLIDSQGFDIIDLQDGVAALGTSVTGVTASLSALSDTVDGLGDDVAANGTALSTLSATVSSQGDDIAANTSAITASNAAIADKADASTVSALSSTVSSQGDAITANGAAIDALEVTVNDPSTGVSATASALSSLSGVVASQGGEITANADAITALEVTVNDPDTGVSATASAVSAMGVSVDTLTDTLEAYYTVQLDVDGNIAGIYLLNNGVTSEFSVRADTFAVKSASGVSALTWQAGVLTALDGSNSLKLGAGFGSDTDKLIFAYGADGSTSSRTFAGSKVAITAGGKAKLAGALTNFASGWSGAAVTSSYNSSSPATVTINVASGTFTYGGTAVSYSASSNTTTQTRGTTQRYYLYYSDAGLTGGAKTLNISTSSSVAYSDPDKVFVGYVDVTVPASGSGSGGGGGGSDGCVSVDAWVVRNGQRSRAGDVQVGDLLSLYDSLLGASEGRVTYSVPVLSNRVQIVTESLRTLTCSTTAPIPTESGELVLAPDLLGHRVLVDDGGVLSWEVVADIVRLPQGWVQHITVGDRCFWAGDESAYLLHHNYKPMTP